MTRGQVAVETAMVLPLLVFLALGLIQLTLMQQARLMTEYAAFQAARSGAVWNGNLERMRDAAVLSLLPTMGRTDDLASLAQTFEAQAKTSASLESLPWGAAAPATFNGVPMRGQVRVDTLSPAGYPALSQSPRVRGGAAWQELDFDDVDTFGESPSLPQRLGALYSLDAPDKDEDFLRRAMVLSIRLRYLYELRIPFANSIIFVSWYAANAGVALGGGFGRENVRGGGIFSDADVSGLRESAAGLDMATKGFAPLTVGEMHTLWDLSKGLFGQGPRFYFPLFATHSMRMQSNFHRKWIVHGKPTWQP